MLRANAYLRCCDDFNDNRLKTSLYSFSAGILSTVEIVPLGKLIEAVLRNCQYTFSGFLKRAVETHMRL